jgi:hypothetical protein
LDICIILGDLAILVWVQHRKYLFEFRPFYSVNNLRRFIIGFGPVLPLQFYLTFDSVLNLFFLLLSSHKFAV